MNKLIIGIIIILILLIIINIVKINFEVDKTNKFELKDECYFDGNGFDKNHEVGECSVSIQIIPLVKNVIEIGGGAGKVSHMINKILSNRNLQTQHVVVEPGEGAIGNHGNEKIYANKEMFNDKYTIIKKFCGDLVIDDIKIFNDPPDCLYVDCEGCLKDCQITPFFKYVLTNVRYIVNEMDGHNDIIREQWKLYGFKQIGVGYGCGTGCETEIWSK
jgi:hypothetical protein